MNLLRSLFILCFSVSVLFTKYLYIYMFIQKCFMLSNTTNSNIYASIHHFVNNRCRRSRHRHRHIITSAHHLCSRFNSQSSFSSYSSSSYSFIRLFIQSNPHNNLIYLGQFNNYYYYYHCNKTTEINYKTVVVCILYKEICYKYYKYIKRERKNNYLR